MEGLWKEDTKIVEASVEKVVSVDREGVSHDEGSFQERFQLLSKRNKLLREPLVSVDRVEEFLRVVGCKADFVDEVDHAVHYREENLLYCLGSLNHGCIIRDQEVFGSNSAD